MKIKYVLTLGMFSLAMVVLAPLLSACSLLGQTNKAQSAVTPSTSTPSTSTSTAPGASFDGYGIYESCSPKDEAASCFSHLDTMAAAGFKLVLNYVELYGDANFQKAYLDHAQSVGMKVILPFKDPTFYSGGSLRAKFPALAQTCNCSNNTGFMQYVVNLVKNHPALWGYYVGDEVSPGNHDNLKSELADVVHRLDPKHPRLFIDSAGNSTAVWRGNSPFYDTADVIGSDFYPVREGLNNYPTIDETARVASGTQMYADAHGESAAIVLQAFSRSQYGVSGDPYPTADQMQTMLSQTLANAHPRVILWYSYYDTMSFDNGTQNWANLKATIARNIPKY
ncbi:MAG: hypothetical protein JOZ18_03780 [Chloroflexi bacterium]|nr:hypothetical protein [Chloroflexota bacterium]